jgi:hypothetical protein
MNIDLVTPLEKLFASRAAPRMARSVNASAIGHPCARSLVFDQCRIAAANAELMPIFALGNMHERQAMIDLAEALHGTGMDVVRQQTPLPPNPYGIGGIIDLFIEYREGGKRIVVPGEFKSCAPQTYDKIDTLQDMKDAKQPWVRKYPAQLMIYLLLTNSPNGFFLLRNKITGKYKQINVPLDYEYAETLVKKAEEVTAAVAKYRAAQTDEERVQALPPRIPFDPSICERCPHYEVCIPDPNSLPEADNRLWDVHLDALCREAERLEPMADEYEAAMEKIKAHCKSLVKGCPDGQQRTSITENFFVTAKPYQTTSYAVPDEVKAPFKKHGAAVRVSVKRIGTDSQEA